MNHPFELLAEYVDGALSEGERAVVGAHLQACPECRAEIGPAREARRALSALADEPVPAGLGAAAIAEASGVGLEPPRDAVAASGAPRWYRLSGLAAAAAIVGLLAIAIPRLGSEDATSPGAPDRSELSAAAAEGGQPVERQATNYTHGSLGTLLTDRHTEASAGTPGSQALSDGNGEAVLECLARAYPDLAGEPPVRLIRARFQGTDAYIGVFETGPGSGEPPDTREVLAASVLGCRLLSYASSRI
jgi:hypothetical protein